jgi:glycerol-3-phosphate O-acyltransferase
MKNVGQREPNVIPGFGITLGFTTFFLSAIVLLPLSALLLKAGSGVINQKTLEQQCHLAAQRINMLYGFNSPEFFDRSLFENFIDLLRERGVVKAGEGGNLDFDEVLVRVAADAQLVLSEQIRHSILQVTQV